MKTFYWVWLKEKNQWLKSSREVAVVMPEALWTMSPKKPNPLPAFVLGPKQ